MAIVAHLENIFRAFKPNDVVISFEVLTTGNINKTYLVELANEKYILQSINRNVFKHPLSVMNNLNEVMTSFLSNKVEEFISPIATTQHSIFHEDERGDFWRIFPFIKHFPVSIHTDSLQRVGFAYGNFLQALDKIDPSKIQPTIPHFHELDFYFKQFMNAAKLDVKGRVKLCVNEIEFLKSQQHLIKTFKALSIPKRLTHNDAKLDNILFQNEALSKWKVIDYDTIMKGYSIFDYGDLVRSTLSVMNKDATTVSDIVIDEALIGALKKGFIEGAEDVLSDIEIELLDIGVVLILYEQAIRFLSDYLGGDRYYRIEFADQNLVRSRRHIWLLERMG